MNEFIDESIKLFLNRNGWDDALVEPIKSDASFRNYYRIRKKNLTSILMDTSRSSEKIEKFIEVSKLLNNFGLSAPNCLATDFKTGYSLLEDFGENSFNNEILNGKNPLILYEKAVDVLVHIKKQSVSKNFQKFDTKRMLEEVSLFIDWTLPSITGYKVDNINKSEFLLLWKNVLTELEDYKNTLVLFDYHVDNLMWLNSRKGIKKVGLLDFQDALLGPSEYDLVSILEDARRDVEQEIVEEMIRRYLFFCPEKKNTFNKNYSILGAQRNTRILGVFVRLFIRDNKSNYLTFMPRVWDLLEKDLQHPVLSKLHKWYNKNVSKSIRTKEYKKHISVNRELR